MTRFHNNQQFVIMIYSYIQFFHYLHDHRVQSFCESFATSLVVRRGVSTCLFQARYRQVGFCRKISMYLLSPSQQNFTDNHGFKHHQIIVSFLKYDILIIVIKVAQLIVLRPFSIGQSEKGTELIGIRISRGVRSPR